MRTNWTSCKQVNLTAPIFPKGISLEAKDVKRVYSGINGKCCCGCSGKYYEATDPKAARMIARVLKMIALPDTDQRVENLGSCVTVENDKRVWIAYLD